MLDSMDQSRARVVRTTTGEIVESAPPRLGPVMTVSEISSLTNQIKEFINTQLEDGIDYWLPPGAKKRALLKPGSEKFLFWFGMAFEYVHVAGEVTPDRVSHVHGCRLIDVATGKQRAYVERSCNTDEENMQKTWLSLQAKGVSDIRAMDNPVRGMSQKRSLIAATIIATMSSAYLEAREGDQDEAKDLGVNGHSERPDWCSIHRQKMYRKQNDKGEWWSHKLPDGKWCNGPKKDDKPQAAAQPTQQASKPNTPPYPSGRGNILNWIQDQCKDHGTDVLPIIKAAPFMHSALSQCTDDELVKLADILMRKWEPTDAPDTAADAEQAEGAA